MNDDYKYGKPVRLNHTTLDLLNEKLNLANQKSFGRKIRPSDLVYLAINLVTEKHLKKLQSESLSNEDKKDYLFQKYQELHPEASHNDFIGFMMSNEFSKFLKQNGNFDSILAV